MWRRRRNARIVKDTLRETRSVTKEAFMLPSVGIPRDGLEAESLQIALERCSSSTNLLLHQR